METWLVLLCSVKPPPLPPRLVAHDAASLRALTQLVVLVDGTVVSCFVGRNQSTWDRKINLIDICYLPQPAAFDRQVRTSDHSGLRTDQQGRVGVGESVLGIDNQYGWL